jgi:hypothetical protein
MPRTISLPKNNTAIVQDGNTDEQAIAYWKAQRPDIFLPDAPPEKPVPTSRTFGEAAVDIGAGFTKGIGSLVQLPSQVSGLVSGDMEAGTVGKFGKSIEEYGESLKSPYLRAQEAQQQKLTQQAYEKSGILGEAGQAIKGTITNPALLTSFLAEQVPNFIGSSRCWSSCKNWRSDSRPFKHWYHQRCCQYFCKGWGTCCLGYQCGNARYRCRCGDLSIRI